jgi:hypothetical protein
VEKGGINIGGATSSTFTKGVVAGDAGNYDVVVSTPCGLSTTCIGYINVGSTALIHSQPINQFVLVAM